MRVPPVHAEARVEWNREEGPGYWWIRLYCPPIAASAQPGQFVHIRCSPGWVPLLRRPMSIAWTEPREGFLDIHYKVVGIGTHLMSLWRPGQAVDLVGPLGRPFSLLPGLKRAAILGRGVGIAPLLFWARAARQAGAEVWAFLSGRTRSAILGAELIEPYGCHLYLGTDDGYGLGSDGLLREFAETCRRHRIQQVVTCGSKRMARLCEQLERELGLYAEVSLEAQMGCAMGACRGCACTYLEDPDHPDTSPRRFVLVCQDGPVFPVRRVLWHKA